MNGIKRLFFKEKTPPKTHFICYTARALFFSVVLCCLLCERFRSVCTVGCALTDVNPQSSLSLRIIIMYALITH